MSARSLRCEPPRSEFVLVAAILVALSMGFLPMMAAGAAAGHLSGLSNVGAITFSHGKKGGGGGCGGGTVSKVSSSNWGGYASETCLSSPTSNAVNDVKGSWVQPGVTCPSRSTTYSAFWVGIDGYSSSTVEQTGTDSDCSSGSPSYYAWYEFYPAYPVNLPSTSYPVLPGDQISAEVQWVGGSSFTVSISDSTQGWSFSHTGTVSNAARSSAEWIAEAPSSGRVLPLADFGTVTFTACTANLLGTSGPIQGSLWQAAEITMVGHRYVKAAPSGLSAAGESFSVTWNHS